MSVVFSTARLRPNLSNVCIGLQSVSCNSLSATNLDVSSLDLCAGRILATYDLGAAASASPAFNAAGRHAYVACLDGSVHCLTVRQTEAAAGQLTLTLAWVHKLSDPVFSDPAVRPSDGALLVAAVDGTVSALSSAGAGARRRASPS